MRLQSSGKNVIFLVMSSEKRKRALITGITGQDGSYLSELLLNKGYEVHGIKRRGSSFNTGRIDHIYQDPHDKGLRLILHYGDLTDPTNIIRVLKTVEPDEIYNLGAQSHVQVSFEKPEYTAQADAIGVLNLLEAIRILGIEDKVRLYQASSSEMFGASPPPQNEDSYFHPRSPYGVAKLYAYWIVRNYRDAYGIFASNGILFNHESPRRGETFVSRKITRGVARIKLGLQEKIHLGNLDSKRDWGHARDYVEAMHLILQHHKPDDFVIATGKQRSVRELCEAAFREIGIELEWKGSGNDEKGVDKKTGKVFVEIDPRYFRPTEVESLEGDASKAKRELGWEIKTGFDEMVKEMVKHDIEEAEREAHLREGGFRSRGSEND